MIYLIIAIIILIGMIWFNFAPQLGTQSKGNSLERIKSSQNFRNGKFKNLVKTTVRKENTPFFKTIKDYFNGEGNRTPDSVIQTMAFNKEDFIKYDSGLLVVWFGHSTVFLNIDGYFVLIDPVFSERASPISFIGTKSFGYSNPVDVKNLPKINMVLISHDHYDHLDYKTIKQLNNKVDKFLVPLGVAAHLEKWGVLREKIVELDWWENYSIDSVKSIIASPARHFSGRKIIDLNKTLWCSWIIDINNHKVFFCGDSGYGKHFKEIGDNYGPFELTLLECGQYNEDWPYIHMLPNKIIIAHDDLKGETLLPIHWGKFNISLHSWTDPMKQLFLNAENRNCKILTPVIGDIIKINSNKNTGAFWWEN